MSYILTIRWPDSLFVCLFVCLFVFFLSGGAGEKQGIGKGKSFIPPEGQA